MEMSKLTLDGTKSNDGAIGVVFDMVFDITWLLLWSNPSSFILVYNVLHHEVRAPSIFAASEAYSLIQCMSYMIWAQSHGGIIMCTFMHVYI